MNSMILEKKQLIVSYERYNQEKNNRATWEIVSKVFDDQLECAIFIDRISENVIVRRIWVK